eukprot:s1149_g2.t1
MDARHRFCTFAPFLCSSSFGSHNAGRALETHLSAPALARGAFIYSIVDGSVFECVFLPTPHPQRLNRTPEYFMRTGVGQAEELVSSVNPCHANQICAGRFRHECPLQTQLSLPGVCQKVSLSRCVAQPNQTTSNDCSYHIHPHTRKELHTVKQRPPNT